MVAPVAGEKLRETGEGWQAGTTGKYGSLVRPHPGGRFPPCARGYTVSCPATPEQFAVRRLRLSIRPAEDAKPQAAKGAFLPRWSSLLLGRRFDQGRLHWVFRLFAGLDLEGQYRADRLEFVFLGVATLVAGVEQFQHHGVGAGFLLRQVHGRLRTSLDNGLRLAVLLEMVLQAKTRIVLD